MLAQRWTKKLAGEQGTAVYWATMSPQDEEDLARIRRHREERAGWGFQTIECGGAIPEKAGALSADSAVLFDSATALLANRMFGEGFQPDAAEQVWTELAELSSVPAHFVLVCDEIFRDGFVFDEWTETYRRGLAQICRQAAQEFDVVCEVVCGVPVFRKGAMS